MGGVAHLNYGDNYMGELVTTGNRGAIWILFLEKAIERGAVSLNSFSPVPQSTSPTT